MTKKEFRAKVKEILIKDSELTGDAIDRISLLIYDSIPRRSFNYKCLNLWDCVTSLLRERLFTEEQEN